jgi:protein arginine kinase
MAIQAVLEQSPPWAQASAPQGAVALFSQCSLARNFRDFPFPHRCSEEELAAVEGRVLYALEQLNMLSTGTYYALRDLPAWARGVLAERHLITRQLLGRSGARGVYISEDQALSIMINGADHVCVRALVPGIQPQEAWARINLIDDTLAGILEFSFDPQWGYLGADFSGLGTGLKAGVLLHLPILEWNQALGGVSQAAENQGLGLYGVLPSDCAASSTGPGEEAASLLSEKDGAVCCDPHESTGSLYLVCNRATLGASEAEFVFRVRQAAEALAKEEHEARTLLREQTPDVLQDRVGRARGISAGAHFLEFHEAMDILSTLRLGVEQKLVPGVDLRQVNSLFLASQRGHLAARGEDGDALSLNAARANLFRDLPNLSY